MINAFEWLETATPSEVVRDIKTLQDNASSLGEQVERLQTLVGAAGHALRSYQYGNASTELAEGVADKIDAELSVDDMEKSE